MFMAQFSFIKIESARRLRNDLYKSFFEKDFI